MIKSDILRVFRNQLTGFTLLFFLSILTVIFSKQLQIFWSKFFGGLNLTMLSA